MDDSPQNIIDEGERFFRELADFAPVMIWRAGTDVLRWLFQTVEHLGAGFGNVPVR
jgi:hypothetical protein